LRPPGRVCAGGHARRSSRRPNDQTGRALLAIPDARQREGPTLKASCHPIAGGSHSSGLTAVQPATLGSDVNYLWDGDDLPAGTDLARTVNGKAASATFVSSLLIRRFSANPADCESRRGPCRACRSREFTPCASRDAATPGNHVRFPGDRARERGGGTRGRNDMGAPLRGHGRALSRPGAPFASTPERHDHAFHL
jgi:hypothetical protein